MSIYKIQPWQSRPSEIGFYNSLDLCTWLNTRGLHHLCRGYFRHVGSGFLISPLPNDFTTYNNLVHTSSVDRCDYSLSLGDLTLDNFDWSIITHEVEQKTSIRIGNKDFGRFILPEQAFVLLEKMGFEYIKRAQFERQGILAQIVHDDLTRDILTICNALEKLDSRIPYDEDTIDPESFIESDIEDHIVMLSSGRWRAGDILSSDTLRESIDFLVSDGWVYSHGGFKKENDRVKIEDTKGEYTSMAICLMIKRHLGIQ